MKKRLLSALTAFSLCLPLLPVGLLPARAADWAPQSVKYTPLVPEVALLNAKTGTDEKFYKDILSAYSTKDDDQKNYTRYNAINLYNKTDGSQAQYSDRGADTTWVWNETAHPFQSSTLLKLMDVNCWGNLEVNLSASFYNHNHTHKKRTVTSFEAVYLSVGGRYLRQVIGDSKSTTKYPRIGNLGDLDNYTSLNVIASTKPAGGEIRFRHDNLSCTCGKTYAENLLITFRDRQAPTLGDVSYSVSNSATTAETFTQNTTRAYVGKDQYLHIKLHFREPIRFADDNAKDKQNYFISLQGDGKLDTSKKAYLYKLEGNDLYFVYKNETTDTQLNIAALNLSELFKETALVQTGNGSGSFSIKLDNDAKKEGYNTSPCVITDLAGNALSLDTSSVTSGSSAVSQYLVNGANLTVDSKAPTVSKINFDLTLNNAEVKQARGVADLLPGTEKYEQEYKDNSDLYLGVGDTLTLRVTMSEVLALGNTTKLTPTTVSYEDATVTTNLKQGNQYVTVKSQYFYTETDKTDSSEHTVFQMEPLVITEDMTLDGGEIKVTDFTFDSTVTDLAKNAYGGKIEDTANANPPLLDVTPPTVAAPANTYAYDGETNSFRYALNITDAASTATGVYGQFTLTNGGDGRDYRYQWVATVSGETDDNTEWNTGTTGVAQQFLQLGAPTYLHIRPAEDETYLNLSDCSLQVTAKDFAGNASGVFDTKTESDENKVKWFIDRTAPTVTAGDSTRRLIDNGAQGELTVNFTLTDSNGVSGWEYLWTEDEDEPGENARWNNGTGSGTGTVSGAVTETISATGGDEDDRYFSKYLWIRAADDIKSTNSDFTNNVSVTCLGRYSYDLRQAQYELTYSTAITERADLRLSSLNEADTVVLMVEVPDTGNCAVLVPTGADPGKNLFASDENWYYMTRSEQEGNYTFSATEDNDTPVSMNSSTARSWWSKVTDGDYAGKLNVTVLSGKKDAVTLSGNVPTAVGNSSYAIAADTFVLRPLGSDAAEPYEFSTSTVLEPLSTVTNIAGKTWNSSQNTVLSTLEGLSFRFTLDKDNYGYNFEDINFDGSYLQLKRARPNIKGSTDEELIYQVPLKATAPSDGALTQIITIPAADKTSKNSKTAYEGGGYQVSVHLDCKVGEDQDYYFSCDTPDVSDPVIGRIQVDDTPACENFGITSITAKVENVPYYGTPTEVSCVQGNGIYYLPTSGVSQSGQSYTFTIKAGGAATDLTMLGSGFAKENELNTGVFNGQLSTRIQNTTTGFVHTLEVNHKGKSNFDSAKSSYDLKVVDSLPNTLDANLLYLKPNTDNVLAIQQVYANGRKSDVVYQTIHPVVNTYTGTAWVTAENGGQVVFTPDKSKSLPEELSVFAYAQTKQDSDNNVERLEMMPQADGTWRCGFLDTSTITVDNTRLIYRICATDRYGNFYLLKEGEQAAVMRRFPFESSQEQGGHDPSSATPDPEKGTYELTFHMMYDGYDGKKGFLTASDPIIDHCAAPTGLTLHFSDPTAGTLWISDVELTELTGALGDWSDWTNGAKTWTFDGESLSGISEIQVHRYANRVGTWDYGSYVELTVTVKGRVPAGFSGNFDATLTVTDAFGFSGDSATLTVEGMTDITPSAYDDTAADGLKPSYDPQNGQLTLHFNRPVTPVKSWAWQGVENSWEAEYRTVWTGAFPVSGNGTTDIQFKDTFGKVYTQSLTTNAFTVDGTDHSLALYFSTEQYTGEAVTVTVTAANKGSLAAMSIDNTPITASDNGTITVTQENNGCFVLQHGFGGNNGGRPYGLNVYITNIAKEAPAAVLSYYIPSLGAEFSQSELERYIETYGTETNGQKSLTVLGDVLVWYTTSRHVTPTGDSGSEFRFTLDNQTDSHTFTYVDDLGNEGTATATLPAGLVLVEAQPPTDTTPPTVDVDLYARRFGGYTLETSFAPGDESKDSSDETSLAAKLAEAGYVQGYSLTVNAFDPSGFTIELSNPPDGVTLKGNVITITKAAGFTVTIKGKSTNQNAVSFTIDQSALTPYLDTTPPTAVITDASKSLYEKVFFIKLSDTNDSGTYTNTDDVTLVAPVGLKKVPDTAATEPDRSHIGEYKLTTSDNGDIDFLFYDQAGNQGRATHTVSGIDTTPPTLSVTWTPPSTTYDENDKLIADHSTLTYKPINTNVMAFIDSDKPIYDLTLTPKSGAEVELLSKGQPTVNLPFVYPAGATGDDIQLRVSATSSRVTVTYYANTCKDTETLTFNLSAPNRRTAKAVLGSVGIIDKKAPTITQKTEELKRVKSGSGESAVYYDTPYAIKVSLYPDETATSPNYGTTDRWTDPDTGTTILNPSQYGGESNGPLILTFLENGAYNIRFVDEVGNITVEPVAISGIDSTAPTITLGDRTENGQQVSVPVTVDENCTLTWGTNSSKAMTTNQPETIEFNENGSFAVTATDSAGNVSIQVVKISGIDHLPPTVSFTSNTIYVMEGTDANDLTAQLRQGYTLWDNVTEKTALEQSLVIDQREVDLNAEGVYSVQYSVTDATGNKTTVKRFVQVIGSNTVCVEISGQLILPGTTASLKKGTEYTLSLRNCDEPYSLKAKPGLLYTGQMKYLSGSSIAFDENGKFTPVSAGFYTLLVTTQSRQTIRVLLYVEQ